MPNPNKPRRSMSSRAGGRPPLISRAGILSAARGIPIGKLTMPLVASRLGVNAAALYYHFQSRAALLAELSSLLVTDFEVEPVDPKRWRPWLERTTLDMYRFLVANPVVFELENWAYAAKVSAPATEHVLGGLQKAGFDTTQSWQMLSVLGAFLYTQARAKHDASRVDAKTKRQILAQVASSLQQLPHLRAANALSAQDPEEAFFENVRWLISLFPAPRATRTAKTKRRRA